MAGQSSGEKLQKLIEYRKGLIDMLTEAGIDTTSFKLSTNDCISEYATQLVETLPGYEGDSAQSKTD